MLRRLGLVLLVLLLGALVLPPLCGVISPDEAPALPAAGKRVVLADGLGVNVLEAGSGPPVVLVHGLPGMAGDWQAMLPELASRGYRAIAYDRVGYGHSDPRPEGSKHTPQQNAKELHQLLDAMDLERVTLVGWSYGGVTSMFAADRWPDRVERLILVGTGGPDSADASPPEPPALMRFMYSDPVLAWRRNVPGLTRGLITAISTQAYSEKEMPDWWIPNVEANFSRLETLHAYRGEMFTVEGELRPSALRVPTLLIHGDDDRLAPVAIAEYLSGVIPGAKKQIIPGGSHMLPVLHAEDLADSIVAFIGG